MPEKTIVGNNTEKKDSIVCREWLTHLENNNLQREFPIRIQKALEGEQLHKNKILDDTKTYCKLARPITVDAYDSETKTAYQFQGCYWHGCRKCNPEQKGRYNRTMEQINLLENDLKQYWFVDCEFSNGYTNYKPSCKENMPDPLDGSCDCSQHGCTSEYGRFDYNNQPERVRCNFMPFFECIYFIMVTISTVGYGDISPTFFTSRVAICILVICTLTILPSQLNKLNGLIALKSPFRANWKPTRDQTHVMVCGDVSRPKLESFFREFFHIDRHSSHGPNLFALILGQHEPSEG